MADAAGRKPMGDGCLRVAILGVVKGGTSTLARALMHGDRSDAALVGPDLGPWNQQSQQSSAELLYCTPHCPGTWGVKPNTLAAGAIARVAGKGGCFACRDRSNASALNETSRDALPNFEEYAAQCSLRACWRSGVFSQYGNRAVPTAGSTQRMLLKNPEALVWPHLAAVHVPEAVRCGTSLVVLLRDPVQRLRSHFAWYFMQQPYDRLRLCSLLLGRADVPQGVGERSVPEGGSNQSVRTRNLMRALGRGKSYAMATAVAFEMWVNASLGAYADALQPLASTSIARGTELHFWRQLVYSLEDRHRRQRWLRFLLSLGLSDPKGVDSATSPPPLLAHNGLSLAKGLLQSVYHPQLLQWLHPPRAWQEWPSAISNHPAGESTRLARAATSHHQHLHVLQSERLFAAGAKAGQQQQQQQPWDLRAWLSKVTGLPAGRLDASVQQLEVSRQPSSRGKRGRGQVTHAAASAKYIAPLDSPVVAAALAQVRSFLEPHTRRTLRLLESVGQPLDESLWQI